MVFVLSISKHSKIAHDGFGNVSVSLINPDWCLLNAVMMDAILFMLATGQERTFKLEYSSPQFGATLYPAMNLPCASTSDNGRPS